MSFSGTDDVFLNSLYAGSRNVTPKSSNNKIPGYFEIEARRFSVSLQQGIVNNPYSNLIWVEQLSSSIGRQVMTGQNPNNKCGFAVS